MKDDRSTKFLKSTNALQVQFSSVTQLCPTFSNPMNHSMPGLPVHHQLPELTQTHVHWCTSFPIWNKFIVPCLVLTVASWPAYRFLRRQVRWSGIPISFRIFHSLTDMNLSKLWETVNDRGAWYAAVLGVAKHWTRLSDWTTKTTTRRADWRLCWQLRE